MDGYRRGERCHGRRLRRRSAEGGNPVECGWLTDRFGVYWQIVPIQLDDMLHDPDPAKAERVVQALLTMVKIDIAALERAYNAE